MARPKKLGLSYFSFDVDIFEDDKLFDVQAKYGPLGEVVYFRILCLVYKNGYYYHFDNIEKLTNMLVKSIGAKWVKDKKVVTDVILCLAKSNLLSLELMHSNVLTSQGIQKRYQAATGRRQPHTKEFWLLKNDEEAFISAPINSVIVDDNSVKVCNNPVNVDDNATKVKKSKVNKSKENESKVVVELPLKNGKIDLIHEIEVEALQQRYKNIDVVLSLKKMSDYLWRNRDKRRDSYGSYIELWLSEDSSKASATEKSKDGIKGSPSYDLSEWEDSNIFDE